MALQNSVGSFYQPFAGRIGDYESPRINYFQTCGSGRTEGALKIIASATTNHQYYINHLSVSHTDPSGNSFINVHVADLNAGYVLGAIATQSIETITYNFGEIGLMLGTVAGTTTATTTVAVVTGGTATVLFCCTGYTIA